MYTVKGIVLVKETQIGIPNLQIILYDIDENISQASLPTPISLQQLPGVRLGSILTDARGAFELEFDDGDFQVPGLEDKPDLILLVMGPEATTAEQSGVSVPLPANERILHYSYDPILNAGRQESYIIQLSQEFLDKFQIPYPSLISKPTSMTSESIGADLGIVPEYVQDSPSADVQQFTAGLASTKSPKTTGRVIPQFHRQVSKSLAGSQVSF